MKTFGWLLKREYWEHRGGFLWAQVWTAGIVLLLIASAVIVGEVLQDKMHATVTVGVSLSALSTSLSQEQMSVVSTALDTSLLSLSLFPQIVLFFVTFFYLLGALYDDRKDRSVLFWKSLPISDIGTVASKLFTAAITAPLMAFAITILMQLAFLLILSVFMLLHNVNPMTLIWHAASPLTVWTKMLVLLPISALWALPSYGWLLLCSSFARSRPIAWAILPLMLLGWAITFSGLLQNFALPSSWYLRNVFMRLLLSIVPASWLWSESGFDKSAIGQVIDGTSAVSGSHETLVLQWNWIFSALSRPDMWIGVAAGVAMLAAAVYFRRRRIESLN